MDNSATAVVVFSAVTSAMWVGTLAWSWSRKTRDERVYNVSILLLATLAWWLGECAAIRLGKYQYSPHFAAWLALPWGGAPHSSDCLARGLHWLTSRVGLPSVEGCSPPQQSWNVPFPIVALEATLVFAFLRLSFFRLKNKGRSAALAAASFSGFLMVTLAAILDPVVSTGQACGSSASSTVCRGLCQFELWHWFTNTTYDGHWFGVPTVNYAAWFIGMGTFSYLARLDDDGPSGMLRRYDRWWEYVWAGVKLIALLFAIQVPLKIAMDLILVRGQEVLQKVFSLPHPPFHPRTWEFGWVAALLLATFFIVWRYGRVHPKPIHEWVCNSPVVVLFLCAVALILEWGGWLNLVWILAAVITMLVTGLPIILDRLPAERRARLCGDRQQVDV